MREIKADEDVSDIVDNQINELWDRATEEKEQVPQGLIGGVPRQD